MPSESRKREIRRFVGFYCYEVPDVVKDVGGAAGGAIVVRVFTPIDTEGVAESRALAFHEFRLILLFFRTPA
jgi:hypothetical protein